MSHQDLTDLEKWATSLKGNTAELGRRVRAVKQGINSGTERSLVWQGFSRQALSDVAACNENIRTLQGSVSTSLPHGFEYSCVIKKYWQEISILNDRQLDRLDGSTHLETHADCAISSLADEIKSSRDDIGLQTELLTTMKATYKQLGETRENLRQRCAEIEGGMQNDKPTLTETLEEINKVLLDLTVEKHRYDNDLEVLRDRSKQFTVQEIRLADDTEEIKNELNSHLLSMTAVSSKFQLPLTGLTELAGCVHHVINNFQLPDESSSLILEKCNRQLVRVQDEILATEATIVRMRSSLKMKLCDTESETESITKIEEDLIASNSHFSSISEELDKFLYSEKEINERLSVTKNDFSANSNIIKLLKKQISTLEENLSEARRVEDECVKLDSVRRKLSEVSAKLSEGKEKNDKRKSELEHLIAEDLEMQGRIESNREKVRLEAEMTIWSIEIEAETHSECSELETKLMEVKKESNDYIQAIRDLKIREETELARIESDILDVLNVNQMSVSAPRQLMPSTNTFRRRIGWSLTGSKPTDNPPFGKGGDPDTKARSQHITRRLKASPRAMSPEASAYETQDEDSLFN